MKKSRRQTIRIVSYLTAVIVALAIWGIVGTVKFRKAEREILSSRERALTSLGTSMATISTGLDKGQYASTEPMMTSLSEEIYRASANAKASLSEIAGTEIEVSSVYRFLSQVGDYAMALNRKASAGEKLTDKEQENLKTLREYASKINTEVSYIISEEQSGGLDFTEVKSTLMATGDEPMQFTGALSDTAQTMENYPTLIYDGPFSDHVGTGKSELTEALDQVTRDEALERAAEFLDKSQDELYFLNECESNLPCYTFYDANNTISVTKKGGIISYFLSSVFAGESLHTAKNAVKIATEFLNGKGYKNIRESYYATTDGICTVNFSYYEEGVTCYTDLIKVGVALDTGDIVSFDSTGYLMNHKARTVPEKTKYTEKTAANILNKNLTVKSVKRCYIPTEFDTEVYTFEYHCTASDGNEVLVYINPDTGEEQELLILLYADGGVLTK